MCLRICRHGDLRRQRRINGSGNRSGRRRFLGRWGFRARGLRLLFRTEEPTPQDKKHQGQGNGYEGSFVIHNQDAGWLRLGTTGSRTWCLGDVFLSRGSGTGSYPPAQRGWQRNSRHAARTKPLIGPCISRACLVYSEHVGRKRQLGGKSGEISIWYPRTKSIKT